MDEEPSLPRLPAVTWDQATQTLGNPRKRGRQTNAPPLYSNSSDPAVFSSDDDPALDNYVAGRRKKRYLGTWFAQEPTSSDSAFEDPSEPGLPQSATRPKRTLERHPDSGVWMGGDDTDVEFDGEALRVSQERQPRMPQRRERKAFQRVPSLRISTGEMTARSIVQKCIDDGKEDIDLSNMGLEDLTNATLQPLSGFSCIPLVTHEVAFEQKPPQLKLYLRANQLTRLPAAIFDLEHLTVLSLMRNHLKEIPPAIAKLKNLYHLNIAMNDLSALPYELLDLCKSKKMDLMLEPNPFYRPEIDLNGWHSLNDWRFEAGHKQKRVAVAPGLSLRSPVQFLDSRGETCSPFRLPSNPVSNPRTTVELDKESCLRSPPGPWHPSEMPSSPQGPSRVPTLIELALQSCYDSPELESIPAMLAHDTPAYVKGHIEAAMAQKETGGWKCSVCQRRMIVPRTVWLEWWDLDVKMCRTNYFKYEVIVDDLVPFLRRGCSWLCVPS